MLLKVLSVALVSLLSAAQPAAPTSAPALHRERIALSGGGHYWLATPEGYQHGDEAPLVICLHGTDDRADDTLGIWSSLGLARGAVWAAPKGVGRGWESDDLPHLRAMWQDLQERVTFDDDRVLLAGFSAGGAMTFHWLYRERFPATAAVTLANYLPPRVTGEDIAAQKHVPIFYGVGMADINHDRMLRGLALLRENGAHVTVYRPPIEHRLSPEVARAALAWFEERCHATLAEQLRDARAALAQGKSGAAAVLAEGIVAQKRWHAPDVVTVATELVEQANASGRERMGRASGMVADGRAFEAFELLRGVQADYGASSIGRAAQQQADALGKRADVQERLAARRRARREQDARDVYLAVQRLIADGRFDEARTKCEVLVAQYEGTEAARHAARILPKLPTRRGR